jgi:alginate export protein
LKRFLCLLLLSPAWVCAQSAPPPPEGSILTPVNNELPSWLRLSGEYRVRAEGYEGGAYTEGNNQGYLLSRFQLNMDMRFSWLRVFAQTEDARVLGNDAIPDAYPYQDTFDLRQAFVELGNIEKGHFALRAGRQELSFGDQRILGPSNWLNTPRTFDAVHADLNYGKLRVDAFSASLVNAVDGSFDHSRAGNDLHGLYGTISRVLPGATIEPYFFWHLGAGLRTEEGLAARRSTKTIAVRIARPAKDRLDYEAHLLRQFGSIGSDSVSAYAMNFDLGYTCSKATWKPRVYGDYAYASGDKNPHDGTINTFDQIYPSNHGLYGIVDLFAWQNLQDEKIGLELKPGKRLMISTVFHNLNLANSHDALYNGSTNPVARNAVGQNGGHIGREWEGTGTFRVTKYLTSGLGYGHLFPGDFMKKATKGSSYNIAYLFFTYGF